MSKAPGKRARSGSPRDPDDGPPRKRPRRLPPDGEEYIPRPKNKFLCFRCDMAQVARANEEFKDKAVNEGKRIGMLWKSLTEEEMAPYVEMARLEKIKHAEMYPEYKYRPRPKEDKKKRRKERERDMSSSPDSPRPGGNGSAAVGTDVPPAAGLILPPSQNTAAVDGLPNFMDALPYTTFDPRIAAPDLYEGMLGLNNLMQNIPLASEFSFYTPSLNDRWLQLATDLGYTSNGPPYNAPPFATPAGSFSFDPGWLGANSFSSNVSENPAYLPTGELQTLLPPGPIPATQAQTYEQPASFDLISDEIAPFSVNRTVSTTSRKRKKPPVAAGSSSAATKENLPTVTIDHSSSSAPTCKPPRKRKQAGAPIVPTEVSAQAAKPSKRQTRTKRLKDAPAETAGGGILQAASQPIVCSSSPPPYQVPQQSESLEIANSAVDIIGPPLQTMCADLELEGARQPHEAEGHTTFEAHAASELYQQSVSNSFGDQYTDFLPCPPVTPYPDGQGCALPMPAFHGILDIESSSFEDYFPGNIPSLDDLWTPVISDEFDFGYL